MRISPKGVHFSIRRVALLASSDTCYAARMMKHRHHVWDGAPPWAFEIRSTLEEVLSKLDDMNAALDDLTKAQAANFAEMDLLLTKIGAPGTSDADVDAAIGRIRALIAASNDEVAKAQGQVPG